jgi:hypothetical protein
MGTHQGILPGFGSNGFSRRVRVYDLPRRDDTEPIELVVMPLQAVFEQAVSGKLPQSLHVGGVDGGGKFQVLKIQPCHANVGGMTELILRQGTILKGLE